MRATSPVNVSHMPNNTASQAPSTTTDATNVERADVSRSIALVRHEITELFNDARRSRPFFAGSKEEAEAKLSSALKVLSEFAQNLDAIKKR